MKEEISILLQMQEKDLEILKIKETQQKEPARINDLQKKQQKAADELKQTQEEKKQTIVKKETLETEVEAMGEKINKCQVQLYQLKNNTEYAAMKKEIATLQEKRSAMEDDILNHMEKIDSIKLEIVKKEALVKEKENELNEEKKKVDEELKKLSNQLQELVSEKETIAKKLDKSFLTVYNKVLKNKGGQAVVPLANKVCGGCHMILPPNVLNEVMRDDHKIVTCDNCNSILYYKEQ